MGDNRRVTLEITDDVAHVRLTRAEARNAIDPAWGAALADAVEVLDGRLDLRAVLITADGPHFSVGGDLHHIVAQVDHLSAELSRMIGPYHAALSQLAALTVPVVCAVHGAAAGGALGLLWCADVVLAADDLKLVAGFAALGLSGDGGSTWALPRLVGLRRASQLLIGGRVLGAEEALEWGLVDRVVEADRLRAEAEAEVARLAAGPTVAYAHMKRLMRSSWTASWTDHLAAERAAMIACGQTDDACEGIESFAERRTPKFGGR